MTPVTVAAPPSKSLSHRAVIGAALAKGVSTLTQVLESDDLSRTVEILQGCGAGIERGEPGEYRISGCDGRLRGGKDSPLSCYVGESGTTCRLLTAVLATGQGLFHIHGTGRMHERPLQDLTDALQSLGATIRFEQKPGCPPLLLHAQGLAASPARAAAPDNAWTPVRCDTSSQFLSGLLLAAPLAGGQLAPAPAGAPAMLGLRLLLAGEKAVSWPYISLTLQTLKDFGLSFEVETRDAAGNWTRTDWRGLRTARPGETRFSVPQGRYQPFQGRVEGDYSGASYLLAAGALGPRPVTVTGLRRDSLQGDAAILDILARMGAVVAWKDGAVTVSPPANGVLYGLDLNMGDCPDLVPTVAVLAARASGTTRIRNVAHLRHKESDRLAAPAMELAKIGCAVSVTEDGLILVPAPKGRHDGSPAQEAVPHDRRNGNPAKETASLAFSCHNDHRMAMSLALLELTGDITVSLDDPACVAKSFPGFWRVWQQIHPGSQAGKRALSQTR